MTLYRVAWLIDLDADSPQEAAEKARVIQQNTDPESIGHVYDVYYKENGEPVHTHIDLDEIEGRV